MPPLLTRESFQPSPSAPPPQRRAYKLKSWTDSEDFLTQLAKISGKLLKGGDPDLNIAARMVLLDWQKGKIPFFTLPPGHTEEKPPPTVCRRSSTGEGRMKVRLTPPRFC